jgi:hypothetical protein
MRRLAAALLLVPSLAAAQGLTCWVPYPSFEEHVPHFDVSRCPGDVVRPEDGFCRLAIRGDAVVIYAFRHNDEAGGPCLVGAERLAIAEFLRRFGTTYLAPR